MADIAQMRVWDLERINQKYYDSTEGCHCISIDLSCTVALDKSHPGYEAPKYSSADHFEEQSKYASESVPQDEEKFQTCESKSTLSLNAIPIAPITMKKIGASDRI